MDDRRTKGGGHSFVTIETWAEGDTISHMHRAMPQLI